MVCWWRRWSAAVLRWLADLVIQHCMDGDQSQVSRCYRPSFSSAGSQGYKSDLYAHDCRGAVSRSDRLCYQCAVLVCVIDGP